jgi:hypothetical protein
MGHRIKKVVFASLALTALLLMTAQTEAAPHKRKETNSQLASRDVNGNSAQWKAHPEKGWVRAEEVEQQQKGRKQSSKRANGNSLNGSKKAPQAK